MTVTALDRPAGITDPGQVAGDDGRRPDPEVPARARRRTFTAQYKQEILAAYDVAPDGEKGAILRREGLYSSLISEWRRLRDPGVLAQKPGKKIGRLSGEHRTETRCAKSDKETVDSGLHSCTVYISPNRSPAYLIRVRHPLNDSGLTNELNLTVSEGEDAKDRVPE